MLGWPPTWAVHRYRPRRRTIVNIWCERRSVAVRSASRNVSTAQGSWTCAIRCGGRRGRQFAQQLPSVQPRVVAVVEADAYRVVADQLGSGGGKRSSASMTRRKHVERVLRHRLAFGACLGAWTHPPQQRDRQESHGAVMKRDVQATLPIQMEGARRRLGCVEMIHGAIVAASVGFRA